MHWNGEITLGNLLTILAFLGAIFAAWTDLNWRVKNLETWRKEHIVDSDARDVINKKLTEILSRLTPQRRGGD